MSDVELEASSEWDENYKVDEIKRDGEHPWHSSANPKTAQWIVFKFKKVTPVSGFRVKQLDAWSKYGFKNFKFETSNDELIWSLIYSGQASNLGCCNWEEVDFGKSNRSKRFRLLMNDSWETNSHFAIAQLELKVCSGISISN